MGGVVSLFDSCGPAGNSPAAYMDYELEKESRVKIHTRRRKMDVMGTAMEMAVDDIRLLVGMYSDNEEQAEADVDYMDMSQLKQRYMNRKRHGSDESNMRDDASDISSFHGSAFNHNLQNRKREAQKKKTNNYKLTNQKLQSHRKIKTKQNELDQSSTNIQKIQNPAGFGNPSGGLMSARKFGGL